MAPYRSRKNPDDLDDQKTARIELRAQPAREERIRYAAKLANQSVSAFILEAASDRAEDVIAEVAGTVVPSDFFDKLVDSLEKRSVPNKRLAAQAKRPRRYVQR